MPVRDRVQLRRRLAEIAGSQAGYFTAAQALEAGYSYPAQRYHVHRGNWTQVDRAIFRVPEWPSAPNEHLVRWSLWSKGRAIISHETALSVHELGNVNPARVHLTVPERFRQSARGVVLHRGDVPESDVQEQEGYRITAPLPSLLDVATGDLEIDELAIAIDDGLRRGLVTPQMLRARADEFGSHAALRVERALQQVSA
jgi:hypothetical protein